jgi:NAD-dependent deacetylase
MAGNTDVIEFHGNFAWQRCMQCDHRLETRRVDMVDLPPRCACGGILRPECVFFGEAISPEDLNRSRQAASNCDVMLVVGTSAMVQPAAYMPLIAKRAGARIIEINSERTPLTREVSDLLIQGKAGEIFNRLLAEIEKLR